MRHENARRDLRAITKEELDRGIWLAVNEWSKARLGAVLISRAIRYDMLQAAYYWLQRAQDETNPH